MKPLLKTQLLTFLKRFNDFKDAEFRSLKVISATQMSMTLAVQDASRAYDWITVTLEFSGVSDAKLLQEKQLFCIDMSEGISLISIENKFAFAISECYNISNVRNSSLYLIADSVKYQEGQF